MLIPPVFPALNQDTALSSSWNKTGALDLPPALLLTHASFHGRNRSLTWNIEGLHFLNGSKEGHIFPLFKLWKEYNFFSPLCRGPSEHTGPLLTASHSLHLSTCSLHLISTFYSHVSIFIFNLTVLLFLHIANFAACHVN